jgi:MoaA/NifB/PqqE/SkfB family radical SAM enzyme
MHRKRVFRNAFHYSKNYLRNRPFHVTAQITFRCNLGCRYCYLTNKKYELSEIPANEWKGIILGLEKWLGSFNLIISGGEPLLEKAKLLDIIKFASGRRLPVSIYTNGTLITREPLEAMKAFGLSRIYISVDGLSPETHEALRKGHGNYPRLLAALELVDELGMKSMTTITSVITEQNISEIPELVGWVKEKGFSGISFNSACLFKTIPKSPEWEQQIWPQNKSTITKSLDRIISMKLRQHPIINSMKQLKIFKAYLLDPVNAVKTFNCSAFRHLSVFPDGGIKVCPVGEKFSLSQVKSLYLRNSAETRENILKCSEPCKIIGCNFDDGFRDYARRFLRVR